MPNRFLGRSISSVLSLWSCLLRTDREHDERSERTHPDRLTIIIHMTKGDSAEAKGNEMGGGGGSRRVKSGKRKQQKAQEIQDVIYPP